MTVPRVTGTPATDGGRPPLRERSGYRPEIEGLRAVAALLVAIFHIWLGRVSGGVDVFFVVAGFLITTTLIGQLRTYDRVRPILFLRRLASRLLPAALTVIAVTLILSVLWLPTAFWAQTFREATAAALYAENWQLAFDATDYLALDVFHSPVQHFWAMSVQGQFYLIWLALFAIVAILARRWPAHRTRFVFGALATVFVISLAFSIVATAADQTFTYYNTFARAWEFALGGLAALILPRLRLGAALRAILGWVGLAGVVSCGLVLQVSTLFPGWAALWPTVSALLVLAGGSAGMPLTAGRLLASRPAVWLGGLSYGIYLWHWPLLVFFLEWKNGDDPTLRWGIGIILLSVLLAWLTKKLVEDPVAGWSRSPNRRVRGLATSAMVAGVTVVALASTTLVGVAQNQTYQELAFARTIASGTLDCVGAASLVDSGCTEAEGLDDPIPADPLADYAAPYDLCRTDEIGTEIRECSYGPADAEVRVVLIGNSHAVSWFPALQAIAEQKNWRLDVFFKSGCVFNTASRDFRGETEVRTCLEWGESLRDTLAARPAYDYMLTSYSRPVGFVDDDGDPSAAAGIAGFRAAWEPLLARGTKVWAMLDTPLLTEDTFECYEENLGDLDDCDTPTRAESFTQEDLLVAATDGLDGARLIDMTDYFCTASECPLEIGDVFVYRDTGHFTATYSLSLAPYLEKELSLVETEGLAFGRKAYEPGV